MSVEATTQEAITVLPLDVVMDPYGIDGQPVEPEDLGTNLWHGVQQIVVPESRILSGTPDGVMIATTLRGRDRFIPVPAGMVVFAQGYDPRHDVRSKTGNPADDDGIFLYPPKYVTPEGGLELYQPDPETGWADGPDAVAFREAARVDSRDAIFFGDKPPMRVNTYNTKTLDYATGVVTAATENGDMKLTGAGQAELRELLGEEPIEIAGKQPATVIAQLFIEQVVEPVSRWAGLAEVAAEASRSAGVFGDNTQVSMQDGVAKGYTSGANNNGTELPRRAAPAEVPTTPRGLRTRLAAGAAAMVHTLPLPRSAERAGRHRSNFLGNRSAGRHRLRPAI